MKDVLRYVETLDPAFNLRGKRLSRLMRRQFLPRRFSRACFYASMSRSQTVLFSNPPRSASYRSKIETISAIDKLIEQSFPPGMRYPVVTGPRLNRTTLTLAEFMLRWRRGKAVVGVTDLSFHGTKLHRQIDASLFSHFNLLYSKGLLAASGAGLELLISSRGHHTDSHTDDFDVGNYCFAGKKFWIFWDAIEGRRHGLEDVSRDKVYERARFDIDSFLETRSGGWLVLEDHQALFMPHNFCHRVYTIEPYLGFGTFMLMLPGLVPAVRWWVEHGPTWQIGACDDEVTSRAASIGHYLERQLSQLRRAPATTRRLWGFHHIAPSIAAWNRALSPRQRQRLQEHPIAQHLFCTE